MPQRSARRGSIIFTVAASAHATLPRVFPTKYSSQGTGRTRPQAQLHDDGAIRVMIAFCIAIRRSTSVLITPVSSLPPLTNSRLGSAWCPRGCRVERVLGALVRVPESRPCRQGGRAPRPGIYLRRVVRAPKSRAYRSSLTPT
jgi:hypothetical protein